MNVQDLIRTRRVELGLTLEQVGNYVGVSKSTVKKWETGFISNMRRDKIVKLAEILQLSPIDLINDPETAYIAHDSEEKVAAQKMSLIVSDTDPQIERIVSYAYSLNAQGLERLEQYSEDLASNPKYKKEAPGTIDFVKRKNAAAARSGARVETAPVTPEEEEAALPPDYTGDI